MDDERVDIVNEKDEIIGSTEKQIAHREGFLHRTVISQLINSHGEWTLVKQASDRQDAGQFVSPVGGHVRAGETAEDALLREAEEECGLKGALSYTFIGKKIFNRTVIGRKENHYYLLFEIYTDKELILNEESVGYETFSQSQLKKELHENPKKFGDAFHFVVENFYPKLK